MNPVENLNEFINAALRLLGQAETAGLLYQAEIARLKEENDKLRKEVEDLRAQLDNKGEK